MMDTWLEFSFEIPVILNRMWVLWVQDLSTITKIETFDLYVWNIDVILWNEVRSRILILCKTMCKHFIKRSNASDCSNDRLHITAPLGHHEVQPYHRVSLQYPPWSCDESLTLGFGQGYWKRWTLQKSSATATSLSLWERHRALMSVPSEPSSQTPGESVHVIQRAGGG